MNDSHNSVQICYTISIGFNWESGDRAIFDNKGKIQESH